MSDFLNSVIAQEHLKSMSPVRRKAKDHQYSLWPWKAVRRWATTQTVTVIMPVWVKTKWAAKSHGTKKRKWMTLLWMLTCLRSYQLSLLIKFKSLHPRAKGLHLVKSLPRVKNQSQLRKEAKLLRKVNLTESMRPTRNRLMAWWNVTSKSTSQTNTWSKSITELGPLLS